MNESRTLPAVQRAYLYIVALVAIHMVVLALANLLRVRPGPLVGALPGFSLEPAWQARAAGAAAMALSAAAALAFHLRVSLADRRAVVVGGRAAESRHLVLYGLAVIGLFFAAFS